MNDDLEKLLHEPTLEPVSLDQQEALITLTHRQLQRTRRTRQIARVVMVAMIFAGGIGVGLLLVKPAQELAQSPLPPPVPTASIPLLSAAQYELEAEKTDNATRSAQLYRLAGDQFLEAQDIRSALRCYRLHLSEGGQATRPIFTHDTWLLMSLKTNRTEGDQ